MCGVAGLYSLKREAVDPADLLLMCDAQAHRGPDGAGSVLLAPLRSDAGPRWRELTRQDRVRGLPEFQQHEPAPTDLPAAAPGAYRLGLGHRRLAVLDLSLAGHQPMANEHRSVWISYNGEIYNHVELREELMARGHRFRSTTDTEVVLRLYEEHGVSCVERLNGMFAFAIWDDRAEQLVLARDRYGIKPLYYTDLEGTLVFASEVKAILTLPAFARDINVPALLDYFTFQNTFGETTLFKNVRLLEPGHVLLVRDGRVERRRYWDFDFDAIEEIGEARAKDRLAELLDAAVARHLQSDVPVGAYLSGGMDSGSITALAAARLPRLMTFTGGFDLTDVSGFEAGFDERKDAEIMSARFKTEHYQMVFHAGDLEWALPRVVWAIEDLRVGMCYPYYYTARLASRFVKVVLAGTGGDEIFAGYPWRYKVVADAGTHEEFLARYYRYWNRLVPRARHRDCFTPEVLRQAGAHDPFDSFREFAAAPGAVGDPTRRALYFEAKTFLHGLLVIEDKLSMAHSLESRVPLLDGPLVDFATSLPTRHLIDRTGDGRSAGNENLSGKALFRRAMHGTLPEEILLKPKQGFSAPEQCWYQKPLLSFVQSTLLSPRARARGIFQERFVRTVLDEHWRGSANHRLLIWSLLAFEQWNRLFIDGEPPESPASSDRDSVGVEAATGA